MNPSQLVRLAACLVSIGAAIEAAENLTVGRLYASGGLYDWGVLSTSNKWMQSGVVAAVLSRILVFPGLALVFTVQLAAALCTILGLFPNQSFLLLAAMLAAHALFMLRNQYGLDGSDQMLLLVLAGLAAYQLHPTGTMLTIAFGFIAGQLLLSYLTAGIAKATSATWRGGEALAGILRTNSYGSRSIARFIRNHRWAGRVGCWSVILYECLGPLMVWWHPNLCLLFIAVGVAFHLSIAALMGLNIFLWSFLATYPAVYYTAGLVGTALGLSRSWGSP